MYILLEGRHIALRPMRESDAEMCLRWRQSDRAVLLNRGAQTVDEQVAWFLRQREADYNWVIELSDGSPVGMLSLIGIDQQHRHAEHSHFLIGEPDACKGIPVAAEAMLLLYRFAFTDLRLHRIWGYVASDNVGMIRWHIYTGMVEEGRMPEHLYIGDHWQDAVILGLSEQRFRDYAEARLEAMAR